MFQSRGVLVAVVVVAVLPVLAYDRLLTIAWVGAFPLEVRLVPRADRIVVRVSADTCPWRKWAEELRQDIRRADANFKPVDGFNGSTFTVGPGSDLVIDKFVYDPKKQSGEVVATFGKGVMRFVGGKISKNEGGVTVNTPAGALAIRGGIALANFKSAKEFAILFVFGEYIKLQGLPPVSGRYHVRRSSRASLRKRVRDVALSQVRFVRDCKSRRCYRASRLG